MNLYEVETRSGLRKFIPAESEEDVQEIVKDPEKHPDIHFRAVKVRTVEVDGYTLQLIPNEPEERPRRGRRPSI